MVTLHEKIFHKLLLHWFQISKANFSYINVTTKYGYTFYFGLGLVSTVVVLCTLTQIQGRLNCMQNNHDFGVKITMILLQCIVQWVSSTGVNPKVQGQGSQERAFKANFSFFQPLIIHSHFIGFPCAMS